MPLSVFVDACAPASTAPCSLRPQALEAAEKVFGSVVNSKGFKVIPGCGVIQGDGIDLSTMEKIAQVGAGAVPALCRHGEKSVCGPQKAPTTAVAGHCWVA